MDNEFLNIMSGFIMIVCILYGPVFLYCFFTKDKTGKNKEFENNMPWYHWLAVLMIILGVLFFIIIPGKPLFYLLGNIVVIVIGLLIIAYIPPDIFKKKEKG